MQQTSSGPITAVHVWQTNVAFWNWSWASSVEWGQGGEPAVIALEKQTTPQTPGTQISPWRSTKLAPVHLLETSHAPSRP